MSGSNRSGFRGVVSKKSFWIKGVILLLLAGGAFVLMRRTETVDGGSTFVARRGPLEITVLEGGSLEAMESQDVKCEVRGYQGVKILKIVEEGYQVSEEDIRTNRVLVELDSSELRKLVTQKDIDLETSLAGFVDARQAYDIQLNQNQSDIKAAEQKAKFARMDLEKFLGDKATGKIIAELGLVEEEVLDQTNLVENALAAVAARSSAPPKRSPPQAPGAPAPGARQDVQAALPARTDEVPKVALQVPPQAVPIPTPKPEPAPEPPRPEPARRNSIDFTQYAKAEILGDGEAKQKLRKFDDDLQVAQREMGISQAMLEGTKRLFDKGFVTKTELESDDIKLENSRLKVQTAETARALFIKYEFPKSAEESVSKYAEAVRELSRARKSAISKLVQAEARVRSAEGRYNLETKQRKDLGDQLEKCTIIARKPGLVVYGGGNMNMYYGGPEQQIREGAMVREQQPIITIPDMTKMAVKVRIHESYIKKVRKDQKVRITLDAFPDKILHGEVSKVGLLPDSQNRWMNPDLKVYLTTITVDGVHDWLKPGMSAKAEILVKALRDVVYVPIQAVNPVDGKQLCYVANGSGQERREVEIGDYNDEFIEIKHGLQEGEKVCLRAPVATDKGASGKKPEAPATEKPKPAQKAEPVRVGSAR